jgi:hypothetical protein
MSRQLGDERRRYGRRSLRERFDDLLAWPGEHIPATIALIAFLGVGVAIALSRGLLVQPEQLVTGDCLFVRVAANQGDVRPIGEARDVIGAVLAGRMEKTACDGSHGHEVSAVTDVPLPSIEPGTLPTMLDRAAIEALAGPACTDVFEAYVGRAPEGSRFVTFAVAPDPPEWVASGGRTICLVARSDGGWMDRPARGSAE